MANFQRAIEWLKSGGKVRRPMWKENSYWVFGVDEKITWIDGITAHVHLNQIEATDWEVYEDETKITVQEAMDQGLISKYCSCKLCKNHPENIHNKEKPFCLSDCIAEIKVKGLAKPYFAYDPNHVKKCFKQIDEDIDKEKYGAHDNRAGLISVTIVKGIINSRAGPKLI